MASLTAARLHSYFRLGFKENSFVVTTGSSPVLLVALPFLGFAGQPATKTGTSRDEAYASWNFNKNSNHNVNVGIKNRGSTHTLSLQA